MLFSAIPAFRLCAHLNDELAACSDILVLNVTKLIWFSIKRNALNIAVVCAIVQCSDLEHTARNIDFSLIKDRGSEPVAS